MIRPLLLYTPWHSGTTDLVWFTDRGIGFYPVADPARPYDDAYFAKYISYAATELGIKLDAARIEFVAAFWDGPVLDVGIGCGSFVATREDTVGFDISGRAVEWLRDTGRFADPYSCEPEAVTFWDSFEHIECPEAILCHVLRWVFLSLPIYSGPETVRASRHFRPDEHFWYHTSWGLVRLMSENGFELRGMNWMESQLGRDNIASFAFERRCLDQDAARTR